MSTYLPAVASRLLQSSTARWVLLPSGALVDKLGKQWADADARRKAVRTEAAAKPAQVSRLAAFIQPPIAPRPKSFRESH